MKPSILHATCVSLQGRGVLICGKPGSGKSSLALCLIDRGAVLVADDQTSVIQEGEALIAQAPPSHKGLMEVRGLGICSFSYQERTPLSLWVELCDENDVERLPQPAFIEYNTIEIPLLKIKENDPLGGIKVELKVGSHVSPLP